MHPTRPYNEGDIVISSNLKHNDTKPTLIPCAHSIQIGWGKHILMNLPARYINHSCDPNIGVGGLNECGSYDFVALRDIESDEVRLLYEVQLVVIIGQCIETTNNSFQRS